jgi:ABC-type uncharacterized transport system permease subunit
MTSWCATPSLFFYFCASSLILFDAWRDHPLRRQWAGRAFLAGFAFHSLYIPSAIYLSGPPYLAGRQLTMGLLAWAVAIIYLVMARQERWRQLANYFVPLIFLLHLQSLLWDSSFGSTALQGPWRAVLSVHLAIAVAAVAILLSSFINGLILLWGERRLKSRGSKAAALRLPTLPSLERSLNRLLFVGFVALTLTLATGMLVGAGSANGAQFQAHSWWALGAWVIYAVVLQRRRQYGHRNRSWVILSLVGFAVITLTFLEVHA